MAENDRRSCKEWDPWAYLRDIFDRISTHPASGLAQLLPDQWLSARRQGLGS